MHINLVVCVINIEEDLGCFTNSRYGFEGVAVAKQRKIGYSIELVKIIRSVAHADRRSERESKT
jgi:hypothetical protein